MSEAMTTQELADLVAPGEAVPIVGEPTGPLLSPDPEWLRVKRREIRSRFRPAPTPAMCRTLHGLAQIGPEVERTCTFRWPAFRSHFPFDWMRDG